MSYAHWHVGMEVVCVDDSPNAYGGCLVAGRVYTIAAIIVGPARDLNTGLDCEGTGIRVREIDMCNCDWFFARRFRPVQKRATDISVFTRLLTHPRVRIEEDA